MKIFLRCLMVMTICATVFYGSTRAEAFSIWCESAYEIDKLSCNYRFDYETQQWIGCRQQAMQDMHSCYASVSTWEFGW